MSGTFRSQDPEMREALEGRARRIIEGVAAAYGARATIRVNYGYPPVCNDAALAEAFSRVRGDRTVRRVEPPAADDGRRRLRVLRRSACRA